MDISSLTNLSSVMQRNMLQQENTEVKKNNTESFHVIYNAALDMLNETNQYQNDAELEEIKFAMGLSENTHDLEIAQSKAEIALQYTVAVRDKLLEAYKEIMQMQM